jgi:hypothetical protein
MFSNRTQRDTQPQLPVEAHECVSETSQRVRILAEGEIWRNFQHKMGVVWHRQADTSLRSLSNAIEASAPRLKHSGNVTFSYVSSSGALEEALKTSVADSQLVRDGIISGEQQTLLENELRAMHRFVSAITGKPDAVIDLRIEREHAYIENFHQDYGTALLMTLWGPGTQFIRPTNVPAEHDGAFFRHQLPSPDEVFEVPCRSLLVMRGKSAAESDEPGTPQALWHSSPPKFWNETPQWDLRVLLIVTSPHSEVLPPRPSLLS